MSSNGMRNDLPSEKATSSTRERPCRVTATGVGVSEERPVIRWILASDPAARRVATQPGVQGQKRIVAGCPATWQPPRTRRGGAGSGKGAAQGLVHAREARFELRQ